MRRIMALLALSLSAPAPAAPAGWVAANRQALLREYVELLAIPNVATNLADIRRNADHIAAMMRKRGLAPQLLESEDGKAPPLIFGEWRVPEAKRTYVIYAHYDGQPVTPEQWRVTEPFKPIFMSGRHDKGGSPLPFPETSQIDPDLRIYARSASDDKAGVMAILAAVDALKAEGKHPSFNLKIVLEGEEELGSPNLAGLLRRHKALLASDGWIIVDGPAHQSGPPQLALGVRGDVNVDVTVYGPSRPLHSGHYGNWAPNPAMMLAKLLASMKDDSGRVLIPGWYDDVVPLTDAERKAIAEVPNVDAALKQDLSLGATEGGGAGLTELIHRPSLNINGMRSADVGDAARNVIPSTGTATLDLRLVLGNDPKRQVDKLVRHIRAQGYEVFDRAPTPAERLRFSKVAKVTATPGYPAERISVDHPLAQDVARALKQQGSLVILPTMGGSLPLYVIRQELGAPNVGVALWNHDNNQHAEDENIRLGHLWDGIAALAAVMTME